jgi:hypothetical protein
MATMATSALHPPSLAAVRGWLAHNWPVAAWVLAAVVVTAAGTRIHDLGWVAPVVRPQ